MYTTPYYELRYDAAKNVIYWTVKGFWPSMDVVPEIEQHWDAVLGQAKKPGFHVIADLTTTKVALEDVEQFHVELRQKILQYGIQKFAVIQPASATATLNFKRYEGQVGLGQVKQIKKFDSLADAQAWLDEA